MAAPARRLGLDEPEVVSSASPRGSRSERTEEGLRMTLVELARRMLRAQAMPEGRRDPAGSSQGRDRRSSSSTSASSSGETERTPRTPSRPKRRRLDHDAGAENDSSPLPGGEDEDSEGSDSSPQEGQEGELSDEEEPGQTRLIPQEEVRRILPEVLHILELPVSSQEEAPPDPEMPRGSTMAFPTEPPPLRIPLPLSFYEVLQSEWEAPAKPKPTDPVFSKFYSLTPKAAELLQLPLVDEPVASLFSNSVLPPDGHELPRDPCDRRIEQALRRNFKASSAALRASNACSLFARAAYSWALDLSAADKKLPEGVKDVLKKITLAAAFSADASLDAIQMTARAMAGNVTARRHLWLRGLELDPSTHAKVASMPFKGTQLFGEGIDQHLADDMDKKKVLPSRRRRNSRPKRTSGSRASRSHQGRYH